MTRRFIILDEQFGRWTVLSYAGQSYWKCRCDCGTVRRVWGASLRNGKSTGCIKCRKGARLTHGQKRSRLYTIWSRMKGRCENPNDPAFGRYGGKGISVCKEWRNDFVAFRSWALAHGYQPNLTLDRFPNTLGGYEPSNCRWATYTQQNRNRTNNVPITFNGETLLISELAERHGIPADVLKNRIKRYGWNIDKAITVPVASRIARSPWIEAGLSRSAWYRAQKAINANIDSNEVRDRAAA